MYIVKISSKAFIKKCDEQEIIISSQVESAAQLDTIGDAMRYAAKVNEIFEQAIAQLIYYNK